MTDAKWVALEESEGKIHVIELIDDMVKIKGWESLIQQKNINP